MWTYVVHIYIYMAVHVFNVRAQCGIKPVIGKF